jgi:hypothetical protein
MTHPPDVSPKTGYFITFEMHLHHLKDHPLYVACRLFRLENGEIMTPAVMDSWPSTHILPDPIIGQPFHDYAHTMASYLRPLIAARSGQNNGRRNPLLIGELVGRKGLVPPQGRR